MEIDNLNLTNTSYRDKWTQEWKLTAFRKRLFAVLVIIFIVVSVNPYFFNYIQQRNGIVLNDWLLNFIPQHDVSIPIFCILWSVILLAVCRAVQNPRFLIVAGWTVLLLFVSRIISITLVPLNLPKGLIYLHDPVTAMFYGNQLITKDLFYSGHTATMFLIFLCLENRYDKAYALFATVAIAILLLVQHAHYTIDIVAAPFFTYILYRLSKKIAAY
ncbi:phosphatase PAP2-related protein [uncultured Mucilaginibacter sp.]|uniref:phosphatase PAP2-related protein n=1 Tax=uncultured Mucilaginibacter sp. TaxID=797541 RepID=UPI0026317482|nr:phosphatase PAP2-related protein [uncultured Mucilaginibacter sp.]